MIELSKSFLLVRKGYDFVRHYARIHPWVSGAIAFVVLGGAWYVYGILTAPSSAPRYVLSTVATGTVVATLTESGQVSATTNVEIGAKASGEVLAVLVTPGQTVAQSTVLAYLDPTTAQKEVRDAEAGLESAQIALAKLEKPADAVSRTDAENAAASAKATLAKAHTDGYNDVSNTFLDLSTVVSGLNDILHGITVPNHANQQNEDAYMDMAQGDPNARNYRNAAENAYLIAYAAYTKNLNDFKTTGRDADGATIEALVTETYTTSALVSDALKASNNFLGLVNTYLSNHSYAIPAILTTNISTLTTYTNGTNGHVATLSADMSEFDTSARTLAAAQASLDKVQAGTDPLDIQSAQLSVTRAQNTLTDARTDLANTVVRAPFAGTVARIPVQKYQTIGSGSSVATMVSPHQSANISLNEVDAAKVVVGQKATLTFDALPDITIAGTIASIDALGTVSQGVVTYAATITFDTNNAEVKPGMSVDASIITGSKQGVLVVPSSAVKTNASGSYVQVFNPPLIVTAGAGAQGISSDVPPQTVPVVTGLSSDTGVEIVSGLSAGQQIVTRTIGTATTQTTTSTSGGARGGAGLGGLRL